jgi:hypothetical protein
MKAGENGVNAGKDGPKPALSYEDQYNARDCTLACAAAAFRASVTSM